MKGDLSGLTRPGDAGGTGREAHGELGIPFAPTGFPVEFLALGGIGPGVPVRATRPTSARSCSPRCSSANETQEQSLRLVFHYADDKGLPLLDLADLRALLTFLDSDGARPSWRASAGCSAATVGVLLRALVGARGPAAATSSSASRSWTSRT